MTTQEQSSLEYILFRGRMNKIKKHADLSTKLVDYRSACIIRYALVEGGSLVSIIAYLLTTDWLFLDLVGFVILYFLMLKPTRDRVISE